jgi:hypothetical protein
MDVDNHPNQATFLRVTLVACKASAIRWRGLSSTLMAVSLIVLLSGAIDRILSEGLSFTVSGPAWINVMRVYWLVPFLFTVSLDVTCLIFKLTL